MQNIWEDAVNEILIINHLGTTAEAKTVEEARRVLHKLISYEIQIATDSSVNGGYELRKVNE